MKNKKGSEFKVGEIVVYPKHGVGKIVAVEKANIGEIDIQFYKILVEKEKLTLTVPINQQSKLRPISSINQINKCVSILMEDLHLFFCFLI